MTYVRQLPQGHQAVISARLTLALQELELSSSERVIALEDAMDSKLEDLEELIDIEI